MPETPNELVDGHRSADEQSHNYEENVDESEESYSEHLHQTLLNHCTRLYDEGSPIEEIEQFLLDSRKVSAFFEDAMANDSNQYFEHIGNPAELDRSGSRVDNAKIEKTGSSSTDHCMETRRSSWWRIFSFSWLKIIVLLGLGHIVISHLMDVNPFYYFPTLQEKRCLLPTHPILMEMTRPVADCGFCSSSEEGIVIEMKTVPNKAEFAKVAYSSKPVIIRGAGKSKMPDALSFQQLKEIFQSEPGGVDAVSEECQFLPFRSPFTSLREAFDLISENSSWEEPWYIGWSNCHPGVATKLRELFPRPDFLPEDSSSSAIDWIFIGSPGLGASMHIDYVKRPSWQAQLSGIKRWVLHPPPECESVCPESISFTIYPGDLLFLETNTWYHETVIHNDSFSISIGSEYD